MNFKKFISGVSAFAIAASAFAGMAVTANAESPTLTSDLEVAGYIIKAYYNFTTNADGLLPTDGDLRYREGYGLFNFGRGGRSGSVTLPEGAGLAEDDIVVVDGRATQSYAYSVTIEGTAADATLGTSTGYLVFEAGSDMQTLTFNVGRASTVRAIAVYSKDTSVATADYTVKYIDENKNEIKSTTGNGVVGTQVPVDTAAYYAEGGQKYIYVSDNSADNAIDASGSTVVIVRYRAAAQYSFSVADNQGGSIASGTGYEGDPIKVAYPRYINVNGTLYEKGAENKEYNHAFTLDENNKAVTLDYTATETSNVVFLAEGEDIDGLTASNANNTKIRSSKSGSAYATADTTITTLPAGKYQIYAVLYSGSSGGANLPFTLGSNTFSFETKDNSNWVELNTEELTLTEDTDLVMNIGGGNAAALDLIYVVKTGDYVAPVENKAEATVVDGAAYTKDGGYDQDMVVGVISLEVTGSYDLANATYEGNTGAVTGDSGTVITDTTASVIVVINGATSTDALSQVKFN